MKTNMHSNAFPGAVLEQAHEKIAELEALLNPYTPVYSPEERKNIIKMGRKNLSFVAKAFKYAKERPELVPPYTSMVAFKADFDDAHGLLALCNNIRMVYDRLFYTQMVASSEAFQASLAFYSYLKAAVSQKVPGAETVYRELKKHFPRSKVKDNGGTVENA